MKTKAEIMNRLMKIISRDLSKANRRMDEISARKLREQLDRGHYDELFRIEIGALTNSLVSALYSSGIDFSDRNAVNGIQHLLGVNARGYKFSYKEIRAIKKAEAKGPASPEFRELKKFQATNKYKLFGIADALVDFLGIKPIELYGIVGKIKNYSSLSEEERYLALDKEVKSIIGKNYGISIPTQKELNKLKEKALKGDENDKLKYMIARRDNGTWEFKYGLNYTLLEQNKDYMNIKEALDKKAGRVVQMPENGETFAKVA